MRLATAALVSDPSPGVATWSPLLLSTIPVEELAGVGSWPARAPLPLRRVSPGWTGPDALEAFPLAIGSEELPAMDWVAPVRVPLRRAAGTPPDEPALWLAAQVLENEHAAALAQPGWQAPARRRQAPGSGPVPEPAGPVPLDPIVAPGFATVAGFLGGVAAEWTSAYPLAHRQLPRRAPRRQRDGDVFTLTDVDHHGTPWAVDPAVPTRHCRPHPAGTVAAPVGDPAGFPAGIGFGLAWEVAPQRPVRRPPGARPVPPVELPGLTITLISDDVNLWGWATPGAQRAPARWRMVPVQPLAEAAVNRAAEVEDAALARPAWMVPAPGPVRRSSERAGASAVVVAASSTISTPPSALEPSLTGTASLLLWSVSEPMPVRRRHGEHRAEWFVAPDPRSSGALAVNGPFCVIAGDIYQAGAIVGAIVCGGPVSPAAVQLRFLSQERRQRRQIYELSGNWQFPWGSV